jgi:nucleoside-diphosphate-sugar epimerase
MDEYDLSDDAPPRPHNHLYIHSKFLGQEACRVFADYYALEVPTLLFAGFVNPVNAGSPSSTFAVTWEDSARAIRCALEVPALPAPYEVFNITSDLPQGRYTNAKAKRLLGWQPRDRLVHHWSDLP